MNPDLDKIVERLPNAKKYSDAIYKALMHSLEYELGFDHAIERVKSEGEAVEFNENFSKRIKEKFSELIFLESIICSTGFSYFRDSIIERHLDRSFLSSIQKTNTV